MPHITYKSRKIEYDLARNAKKNINITLKNKGDLFVSAPKRVHIAEIENVLFSKIDWILKTKQSLKSKNMIKNTFTFNTSSTVYIYGRLCHIDVIPADSNYIVLNDDTVLFYVKEKYIDNLKYKNTQFNKLLKEELRCTIVKYLEKYLTLLSKNLSVLEIRIMKSRWGTCIPAKKKIILNFNLVHCPKKAIEYVVLHEVIHLIYPNHGKNFYNMLSAHMHDWKERKNLLQDFVM